MQTFIVLMDGLLPGEYAKQLHPFAVVFAQTLDEAITRAHDHFMYNMKVPSEVVATEGPTTDFHKFDVLENGTRHQVHVLSIPAINMPEKV